MKITVAAAQILTGPNLLRSARIIADWTARAAKAGADVVCFPEGALHGYACTPAYWKKARPRDFLRAEEIVRAAARRHRIAVIFGSAHWAENGVRNSVLILSEKGEVLGRYSKTHLAENWPSPGLEGPLVAKVRGVPSCFIICHDVRYPELVRLPAAAGAQLCYFCSNESGLVEEWKLSAYRAMPIARATENGIFLVMSNTPADPDNLRSSGQSHGQSKIVHPSGNVMVEAGYFEERLVLAEIDTREATRWVAKRSVEDTTALQSWMRDGVRIVRRPSR